MVTRKLALSKRSSRLANDDERTASWLKCPYSAEQWLVYDTYGFDYETINFAFRMPDGRLLREHPSLYATVKEFAYWCREGAYTKIDDAHTHNLSVRSLMYVAHALSLRGVESFSRASPFDIEQITEASRWGAESLIDGAPRLKAFLQDDLKSLLQWPRTNGGVDKEWALAGAGLPSGCYRSRQIKSVFEYCALYLKDPVDVDFH